MLERIIVNENARHATYAMDQCTFAKEIDLGGAMSKRRGQHEGRRYGR